MSGEVPDRVTARYRSKVPPHRISREKKTIDAMLRLFCRDQHGFDGALCGKCEELRQYAHQRLDNCPFQEEKPACKHCEVHCYSTMLRDKVRAVMRYSGPRMLLRHPVLSLRHLIDERRPVPSLKSVKTRSHG